MVNNFLVSCSRSFHFLIGGFALFFGWQALPAQNSVTDSLLKVIANAKDESVRLQATNQLAFKIASSNPDSALQLLEEIHPAVLSADSPSLLVDITYTKGWAYENRLQFDSALVIYEEAKGLAAQTKDRVDIAHCLIQIGQIYQQKNEFDKGFRYLREALKEASTSGDKHVEMRAANALGRSYSFVEKFDSSNIYLNRALGIQKSLGGKRLVAELLVNIANNHGRAGQMALEISHLLKAQEIMRELKDLAGISLIFRNIAVSNFFAGKYPEALENLHKALKTVAATQLDEEIIINLDYLGEVYMTIEDFENAQLYWEKAATAWQKANGDKKNPDFSFKRGRVLLLKEDFKNALQAFLETENLKKEAGQFIGGDLYWNIGQAHERLYDFETSLSNYTKALELSQSTEHYFIRTKSLYGIGKINETKGNQQEALKNFSQAFEVAQKGGLKENEMEAAAGLFRIYKKQNNAAEALYYLELSEIIEDSLYNEKNTKEIARMEAGFEFEKEKQELAFAQEKEREKQENIKRYLWSGIGVAILLLTIGLFYYRSEQKANEKLGKLNTQISKQKEKLEELDQAKSKFFTNISHEFRTPLTIISGMADNIRHKPRAWGEKGSAIIKQNTLSLLNLINQILDLRKLESRNLKLNLMQGNIIEYLDFLKNSYQSYAESEGLQLHFLRPEKQIIMDYDPDKILRIVSNLLSNAIKYNRPDGHIYFHVEKTKEQIIGESLELRVQDTGAGIPQEKLADIFSRFYQVNEPGEKKVVGSGIGLALTYELVQLMGGQIDVESILGKGTAFRVVLPITRTSALNSPFTLPSIPEIGETMTGAFGPQQEPSFSNKADAVTDEMPQLLIVEDNPQIVQILIACLEDEFQLEIANNGQIGIDKALKQIPDIIISDVMMPEKNGYELTSTLKTDERTDHIPIVLLTAKSDVDSRVSGLEKGADAYLAKPFEKKELLAHLNNLLELRKKLQARFSNLSTDGKNVPKIEDPFLQKFYSLVEKELNNAELDMNQLSLSLGMSRVHIFRKLKALTGKSPTLLIRSFRLQKGKELLANTDLTISEVAYDVGFTSLSYFSAAFFEEFGVRPSATRK
ncbi:MAG: tetratricopeptide repeat protein [Bacteroidota bacterium]